MHNLSATKSRFRRDKETSGPRRNGSRITLFVCLILLSVWGHVAQAQTPRKRASFETVYRTERAELLRTKATLQQTLRGLKANSNKQRKRALGKIQSLTQKIRFLRKQVDLWDDKVAQQRRLQQANTDNDQTFKATLKLAATELKTYGIELSEKGSEAQSLKQLIRVSHSLIRRFSGLYRQQGKYYDRSGKQVQGTQVWFGKITALGSHADGGGVLQAAPNKSLRVAPTQSNFSKEANKWAAGKGSYLVPTLLFDPLQKKKATPQEKTWSQTVEDGGPIAVIILVLAGLGVLLLVERALTLLWMSNWRSGRWQPLLQLVRERQWDAARIFIKGMGANTTVLDSILKEPERPRDDMQETASESVLRLMPTFQRSFTLLNVIITIAPLLGLLGTVTGMIATFEVITQFGTGNPKLLSQGISEALITTKLGLAVAVPLLLAKSIFSRWSDRILETLQLRAIIVINQIHQPKSEATNTQQEVTQS